MNHNLKPKQGFTLLEFLIVLAIVGILSAITIPMYRDYIIRSKINEALTILQPLVQAEVENLYDTGRCEKSLEKLTTDGMPTSSQYVKALVVNTADEDRACYLNATLDNSKVGVPLGQETISFKVYRDASNNVMVVSCKNGISQTSIDSKYLPPQCR